MACTAAFVGAFALRFNAGVLMLHVMDVTPSTIAPAAEPPPVVFNLDEWRNEQRARLEQFLAARRRPSSAYWFREILRIRS